MTECNASSSFRWNGQMSLAAERLRGMRVLVVEDSEKLRRSVVTALRRSGYAVDESAALLEMVAAHGCEELQHADAGDTG